MTRDITNLEQMLDRIERAADEREVVSLRALVQTVGRRSFGPLLLMAGVIIISPLSAIPGMATSIGVFVLLIALQLLFQRDYFWLPRWLLARSMSRTKFCRAIQWLRPPARWIDRWLCPRLFFFIDGPGKYMVAVFCILIAAGMPVMELLPFSASTAGVALSAFGLSLLAHDGLLALLAFLGTALALGLVTYSFL